MFAAGLELWTHKHDCCYCDGGGGKKRKGKREHLL